MIKTEHTERFTILHDEDCPTHMALSTQRGCTGYLDWTMVPNDGYPYVRIDLVHDGETCPLHESADVAA